MLNENEEIIKKINNTNSPELKEYKKRNKEYNNTIKKRKVASVLSRMEKRIIDFLAGVVGTIILIPLTLIVLFMKVIHREKGPIFFGQLRIGKNGKIFKIYKFRSMVVGADKILKEYLEKKPEEAKIYEKYRKLNDDPRVTRTGKFLRETSLDEWPQFLNLLIGNMSLVGPRPYMPTEVEAMGKYYKIIIQKKPGLTGPWQVAGRSNLTFNDRLKLDEEYCTNYGNKRDIKIILKTVKKVIKKEGAL